ncbi:MAG: protein phosphatase 2C domain-containing protein [Chloroflexi bacterium]|nr:protein phosphatase 2C domain-containing protein [Chloroflexota bacterium]
MTAWKIARACCCGTLHLTNGQPCQDELFADALGDAECFLGLVSDGAGSASNGGDGASVACGAGADIIEQWIRKAGTCSRITPQDTTAWVEAIRQCIRTTAEEKGRHIGDFACTLLVAIIDKQAACFFQIGDGAMVVGDGDSFRPVFWPDNGEYPNATYFVTDDDALEHLHIEISSSPPDEIAMLSDGLQRMSLVYESKTAYKPFFEPMFNALRKANESECGILSKHMADLLNNPQVNDRTDDDKTLVLATRRHH